MRAWNRRMALFVAKNDFSLFTILSSLSADFLYLNIPIKIKLIDARHCTSTKSLQKTVRNALKIKSNNEHETILKHSKKPELSDIRAVKTLILRKFGLLNDNNKRQATKAE